MASAWRNAWSGSWGNAWGVHTPAPQPIGGVTIITGQFATEVSVTGSVSGSNLTGSIQPVVVLTGSTLD